MGSSYVRYLSSERYEDIRTRKIPEEDLEFGSSLNNEL